MDRLLQPGGDRIDKARHYKKIRNIWIAMIVLGPLLLILSGVLIGVSAQKEWITVLREEDFDYRSWREGYSASISGSNIEEKLRVTIKEKTSDPVSIEFWIEDSWGDEEFRESGMTPETYNIELGYIDYFENFEFFIRIEDEGYTMDDLDVTVQKYDIGTRFIFFCIGSSVMGLLGICLLIFGIIFTALYSNKIKKQDPEYIRAEMIRKQEMKIREQEMIKAREMERRRQRDAMLIRARNLEASYRLDEAAYMYERLNMYEDAGRCRRMKREEVSRHIHVDANDLFDKLQKQGTALPYICPQCRGMVDIDGVDHRHTRCPYCGAVVDFETLKRAAGNLLQ